jgi:hypothetical protein
MTHNPVAEEEISCIGLTSVWSDSHIEKKDGYRCRKRNHDSSLDKKAEI